MSGGKLCRARSLTIGKLSKLTSTAKSMVGKRVFVGPTVSCIIWVILEQVSLSFSRESAGAPISPCVLSEAAGVSCSGEDAGVVGTMSLVTASRDRLATLRLVWARVPFAGLSCSSGSLLLSDSTGSGEVHGSPCLEVEASSSSLRLRRGPFPAPQQQWFK